MIGVAAVDQAGTASGGTHGEVVLQLASVFVAAAPAAAETAAVDAAAGVLQASCELDMTCHIAGRKLGIPRQPWPPSLSIPGGMAMELGKVIPMEIGVPLGVDEGKPLGIPQCTARLPRAG